MSSLSNFIKTSSISLDEMRPNSSLTKMSELSSTSINSLPTPLYTKNFVDKLNTQGITVIKTFSMQLNRKTYIKAHDKLGDIFYIDLNNNVNHEYNSNIESIDYLPINDTELKSMVKEGLSPELKGTVFFYNNHSHFSVLEKQDTGDVNEVYYKLEDESMSGIKETGSVNIYPLFTYDDVITIPKIELKINEHFKKLRYILYKYNTLFFDKLLHKTQQLEKIINKTKERYNQEMEVFRSNYNDLLQSATTFVNNENDLTISGEIKEIEVTDKLYKLNRRYNTILNIYHIDFDLLAFQLDKRYSKLKDNYLLLFYFMLENLENENKTEIINEYIDELGLPEILKNKNLEQIKEIVVNWTSEKTPILEKLSLFFTM